MRFRTLKVLLSVFVLALVVGGCADLRENVPGPWTAFQLMDQSKAKKTVQREAICACSREEALRISVSAARAVGLEPRNIGNHGFGAGSGSTRIIGFEAMSVDLFDDRGGTRISVAGSKADEFIGKVIDLAGGRARRVG